jgi:hypothetical protein
MEKIARRYPDRVVPAAIPPDGWFWRRLFVPLYTRVSWTFKRQAMEKMKMTSQGWAHAARGFGEPWRPPHVSRDGDAAVSEHLQESLNAGG